MIPYRQGTTWHDRSPPGTRRIQIRGAMDIIRSLTEVRGGGGRRGYYLAPANNCRIVNVGAFALAATGNGLFDPNNFMMRPLQARRFYITQNIR